MTDAKGKDAYYFSHDSNAHDDPKIIKLIGSLGLEGYGIYWLLLELLRDQPDFKYPLDLIPDIADRYKTSKEKMSAVINAYHLFDEDKLCFWSDSLNRRMEKREQIRQLKSGAGIKSGEARKKLKELNTSTTSVEQNNNTCSTDVQQGKERKGKEIKGNIKGNNNNEQAVFSLPDWIPLENWTAFLEMRTSIKSIPTEKAKFLIIKELDKLRNQGFSPADILNQSIRNNWKDVFAIKNRDNHNNQTPASNHGNVTDFINEISQGGKG